MDRDKLQKSDTTDGKPHWHYIVMILESREGYYHWVLSEEERKKGFVRPVRRSYIHISCGTVTKMSTPIAETYARDPKYYGSTFCCHCKKHLPVAEFHWDDVEKSQVGS